MLHLLITLIIALIISVISLKAKFLTRDGTVAQFILAVLLFGLGGVKWSVPIVTFFFLSSILSQIRKNKNSEVEKYFEKTGQRDHWQVLANGGIGGVLVIINYISSSELLYLIYVSSVAAVCADTWATEIGTMRREKTYSILNLKPVEQGRSGGISVAGITGSVFGAFIIPVSSVSFLGENYFYWIFAVMVSGFIGSLADSLLGASIQAQFYCGVCGKITEHKTHCDKPALLKKGFYGVNNDVVNFICSCAGGIFIVVLKICL
jgi:uncharacterized protein (TIGR00297 family)